MRDRYEVGPTNKARKWLGPWRVKLNGEVVSYEPTQRSAIEYGVLLARGRWEERRIRAEVIIKGTNGRVRDNRTYGFDPRRTKG